MPYTIGRALRMCESDAVSQQPPSPDPYQQQPGQDPYAQPAQVPPYDPYAQQQGYSQPAAYPSGGYGYAVPPVEKKPLDLAKILFIAAWVIVGLMAVRWFYGVVQDGFPYAYEDGADRLFDGFQDLAQGVFWAGLLLTASKWLEREQQG